MAVLLKCASCGKRLSLHRAELADRILCPACGAILELPGAPEQPAPEPLLSPPSALPTPSPSPAPATPPPAAPRTNLMPIALAALIAASLVGTILLPPLLHYRHQNDEAAYWAATRDTLLALKADAEKLAIAGRLPEAHAKYQQIEQLTAGRKISDSALWDLTERAKYDQDRLFTMLVSSRDATSQPATTPAAPAPSYRAWDAMKSALTDLSRTTPPVGAASADRLFPAPDTQPVTLPIVSAEPPPPQPPALPPTTLPAIVHRSATGDELLDLQIDQALTKGVNFLLKHVEGDQICADDKLPGTYTEGLNALCVYALLQVGQSTRDPRLLPTHPTMRNLIERMKEHPYLIETSDTSAPVTYAHSLRLLALTVHNRPQDRALIQEDLAWLLRANMDGAYTYNDKLGRFDPNAARTSPFLPSDSFTNFYIDPDAPSPTWLHNGEEYTPKKPKEPPSMFERLGNKKDAEYRLQKYTEIPDAPWDNSNTQYALYAVFAAAELGYEVPIDFWLTVEKHWFSCQLPTGEWTYDNKDRRPRFAMTAGGVASLFITHEYLDAPALGAQTGRNPFNQPLARSLAWLEHADHAIQPTYGGVQYLGYNLFNLERAALASGFKYFGPHDWYRELVPRILSLQYPNGAWAADPPPPQSRESYQPDHANALIDTAYMLLFLSRGRHPVLMNKLRFDGYWANRSRDVANLAKFASRELERPFNWQIVTTQRDWSDWLDSPVLYIASHQAPRLKPDDLDKLRAYVHAGGLIFTHADASARAFDTFASDLARQLFPNYRLETLPPNHELYTLNYRVDPTIPLKAVSNGSRLLMIHAPADLSTAWQVRAERTQRAHYELAMNVFLYAAGKSDFRNRLASPYIAPPTARPATTLPFARLKYAGNWDPEPYAFTRFNYHLQRETNWSLDLKTLDLAQLKPGAVPLAHLTGTAALSLTDPELAALKSYVESGGLLLIDACGSSPAFDASVKTLLAKLFPTAQPTPLTPPHPLLKNLDTPSTISLRPYALQKYAKTPPPLQLLSPGQGHVLYSPLDLTTALLNTNTSLLPGLHPPYAQSLLTNLILWSPTASPQ